MKEAPPELDTRKRIYELIDSSPGIHFREIARRLDMPMGVVEYHLHNLEKNDMVVARKEGRYKRYYTEGRVGSRDKKVLAFLRKDIPRRIIMYIMMNPGARHNEMKRELELSGSTLTFHLKKMVKKDVLRETDEDGIKRFHVSDPEAVSRTLILFKRSFMDELVDSFTETWLEMDL